MERILGSETIGQILRRPELAPAYSQIFLGEAMNDFSIDEMHRQTPVWIREDMLDGVNRLWEIAASGEEYAYRLWPESQEPEKEKVSLIHFPAKEKAPFVLICAGGAYCSVASVVEAFPIAAALNKMGYHAFTLEYRSGGLGRFPEPMEDLAQAIRFIHDNAETLNVEFDGYAACGMSAGGHLVASLGAKSLCDFYGDLPRPAALFLGYPVVTMGELTHELSCRTLLGEDATQEQKDRLSMEKQVGKDHPATYLWQCEEDDVVPFANSQLLKTALKEKGVPHMFRSAGGTAHGWALGTGTPMEGWLEEAVEFWMENRK